MNQAGVTTNGHDPSSVLHWTRGLLTVEDLRHSLNGHRTVCVSARAIVTPQAQDHLRSARIAVVREASATHPTAAGWVVAQEREFPLVRSAVQALIREGIAVKFGESAASLLTWTRTTVEAIEHGAMLGAVLLCTDPALVSCLANRNAAVRAVSLCTLAQAAQASLTVSPNLVAVEMPGRTFYEIRQIVRMFVTGVPTCPDGLAIRKEQCSCASRK